MKSQTRLSNFTFTFHLHALKKEMATNSSVLAWRIPGTGEPGGLPSMGSQQQQPHFAREGMDGVKGRAGCWTQVSLIADTVPCAYLLAWATTMKYCRLCGFKMDVYFS